MPRKGLTARLALTLAVLVTGVAAFTVPGPPSAHAAGPNDPFNCATTNPIAQIVGLPPGTTFWMHNGFNGTFSSQSPSTIAYGTGSGAQTGVLGTTPSGCVLNGLSFNPNDGYLYAFENTEVSNSPCSINFATVKIGRDSAGAMAIEAVNRTVTPAAAAPAVNCLAPFAGDLDPLTNKIVIPSGYNDYLSLTALTDLNNFKPYVSLVSPNGGTTTNIAQTFDSSCVPYLQNWLGQLRAFVYRYGYDIAHGLTPMQVAPEGSYQDWSFNPADGQLYAYASVDLRQSDYPSTVAADPTNTLGAPPDGTQTYLGARVAIPAYSWAPAGIASPSYTLARQSDWIVKIDPSNGATTCAAAGAAASSGAINLPVNASKDANLSANEPRYAPATTTLIGGGGVEIAGSGIAASNIMELFDSEQARHFTLDLSSCTFGSSAPSCTPTLQSDALPTGRSRGDGAAYAGRAVTVTKTATGAGATAFTFTVSSSPLDPSTFALTTGASHTATIDALADSVTVVESATTGWTFESATCDQGTVTTSGSTLTIDLTGVAIGVTSVCTVVNAEAAALAATGTDEVPQQVMAALLALLSGLGLSYLGRRRAGARHLA